jgi:mannose-6-phosphate isomerase-like protein (cupin superfamily)
LTPPFGAPKVSLAMRRILIGLTAVAVALGWLQLAPAFGFPVTAPAGMLDRMLGPNREAGLAGWALLLVGELALAAVYFLIVEGRTHSVVAPFAYAVGAWLLTGVVLMPVIGLLQGAPPVGDAAAMRANFFMLNLGLGAAAESLIGWLLFGAVLAAGRTIKVSPKVFGLAAGASVLTAAIALSVPALVARTDSNRVVEGRVPSLPAGPAFISVLELPQPPGAVLGPHSHIGGFVLDVSGTATMMVQGSGVIDVGPGAAVFTAVLQLHDHENRAAVPLAIALALVLLGLTAWLVARRGRRPAVLLTAALLVAGTVATVDPLMNHWYFIGVRPAAMRGAVMQVPAGHRTYESQNLVGLQSGPYLERLTHRTLGAGEATRFSGPAAIVVLDGQASVTTGGRTTDLSAESGVTIAAGEQANVRAGSGSARVLVVELAPSG